jgi:hypothetical protein
VRQAQIPKAGRPGEFRTLGIPTIYDRVARHALLNRLEPIFEPVFDEANFGYGRGRSTKDALRKVWKEIQSGREWIVDADLRDFFGSVDHEKLLTLVARQSDGGQDWGHTRFALNQSRGNSHLLERCFRFGNSAQGHLDQLTPDLLREASDRGQRWMQQMGFSLVRPADADVLRHTQSEIPHRAASALRGCIGAGQDGRGPLLLRKE